MSNQKIRPVFKRKYYVLFGKFIENTISNMVDNKDRVTIASLFFQIGLIITNILILW